MLYDKYVIKENKVYNQATKKFVRPNKKGDVRLYYQDKRYKTMPLQDAIDLIHQHAIEDEVTPLSPANEHLAEVKQAPVKKVERAKKLKKERAKEAKEKRDQVESPHALHPPLHVAPVPDQPILDLHEQANLERDDEKEAVLPGESSDWNMDSKQDWEKFEKLSKDSQVEVLREQFPATWKLVRESQNPTAFVVPHNRETRALFGRYVLKSEKPYDLKSKRYLRRNKRNMYRLFTVGRLYREYNLYDFTAMCRPHGPLPVPPENPEEKQWKKAGARRPDEGPFRWRYWRNFQKRYMSLLPEIMKKERVARWGKKKMPDHEKQARARLVNKAWGDLSQLRVAQDLRAELRRKGLQRQGEERKAQEAKEHKEQVEQLEQFMQQELKEASAIDLVKAGKKQLELKSLVKRNLRTGRSRQSVPRLPREKVLPSHLKPDYLVPPREERSRLYISVFKRSQWFAMSKLLRGKIKLQLKEADYPVLPYVKWSEDELQLPALIRPEDSVAKKRKEQERRSRIEFRAGKLAAFQVPIKKRKKRGSVRVANAKNNPSKFIGAPKKQRRKRRG